MSILDKHQLLHINRASVLLLLSSGKLVMCTRRVYNRILKGHEFTDVRIVHDDKYDHDWIEVLEWTRF